jgi:hypothetical protein
MPRLSAFLGTWRLRRRIVDRRAGTVARLTGTCRFHAEDGGAIQREEGRLSLPGGTVLTATRTYLWHEAGGRLAVRFVDGRAFHDFDAALIAPEATHPCGDDLYRVRYGFGRWPVWRAVWCVVGPRKDLVVASVLAPLAPAVATGQNPAEGATE